MRLRDVRISDVDAYVRMRCDPVMMAELGGPLPREGMADKVRRDVRSAEAGTDWIKMIVPDRREDGDGAGVGSGEAAGIVTLYTHTADGELISEIGWMVLPEFQGQGLGKRAVRAVLERARDDGRWGLVHAFPSVTNAASNGICRTLGFTAVGEKDVPFAGRIFRTRHWTIDPALIPCQAP
ncbi:GNAT family N-acetyltransferase [Streptomyces sp. NBC_01267]|uniref:GNAT family N-acetyltransferase n=1 Tax=Streptomyces sp. NBC_01267 TaxID=2903805 RepID=UPI002E2FFF5F|nr:GNAT family N-acetyltransferase [Streptomyces sp. NBC_01267]